MNRTVFVTLNAANQDGYDTHVVGVFDSRAEADSKRAETPYTAWVEEAEMHERHHSDARLP